MNEQVPPHFHKEDRISLLDVIPDPRIYEALPEREEEGRFAVVRNGSSYDVYVFIDGDWRQVNAPASPSVWELVAYLTQANGANFDVTGLDLDTDLEYEVRIHCRNVTNAGILNCRVNNDSSGSYHEWANSSNRYAGAGTVHDDGSEADTVWQLCTTAGNMSFRSTLHLSYNGGTPLASWLTTGFGKTGDAALAPSTAHGGGAWTKGDNVESLRLTHNSGTDCEWKAWVFRASTS